MYVPVDASYSFEETKRFARTVAATLAEESPKDVVDRVAKSLRRGKVLVDWGQNDPNRSMIAVYSLRAAATPTVSTPLTWKEVEAASESHFGRLRFGPKDVLERLGDLGDLYLPVVELSQRLPNSTPAV